MIKFISKNFYAKIKERKETEKIPTCFEKNQLLPFELNKKMAFEHL